MVINVITNMQIIHRKILKNRLNAIDKSEIRKSSKYQPSRFLVPGKVPEKVPRKGSRKGSTNKSLVSQEFSANRCLFWALKRL